MANGALEEKLADMKELAKGIPDEAFLWMDSAIFLGVISDKVVTVQCKATEIDDQISARGAEIPQNVAKIRMDIGDTLKLAYHNATTTLLGAALDCASLHGNIGAANIYLSFADQYISKLDSSYAQAKRTKKMEIYREGAHLLLSRAEEDVGKIRKYNRTLRDYDEGKIMASSADASDVTRHMQDQRLVAVTDADRKLKQISEHLDTLKSENHMGQATADQIWGQIKGRYEMVKVKVDKYLPKAPNA